MTMKSVTQHLPDMPPPHILAFDDAVEIRGYTRADMISYATTATENNRRANPGFLTRLVWLFRGDVS